MISSALSVDSSDNLSHDDIHYDDIQFPSSIDITKKNDTTNNAPTLVDGAVSSAAGPGGATYIARLIGMIQSSLIQLGCVVDDDDEELISKIESMSIFIHDSMSIGSRNYHSVQHVFDILSSSADEEFRKDPIAILAGIFHDCIYYNVDGGFSPSQAKKLRGAVEIIGQQGSGGVENIAGSNTKLIIHKDASNDPLLHMVMQIYGFASEQELNPLAGQNEFLSAVIAVREFADLLPPPILIQIAVCIEATIPFRTPNKDTGVTPMERLYNNLTNVNEEFHLQLSDDDCIKAVQRAVLLTNEDVANFATTDEAWFLDNAWSLLPESNVALRSSALYTVQEFQFGIVKMHGFYSFLQPKQVFQQFRGVPTDAELAYRTDRAQKNLIIGKKYIASKLISISVLSAIAELTGGDAPISLFMGDLPSRHRPVSKRLEDNLKVITEGEENEGTESSDNNENKSGMGSSSERQERMSILIKDSFCPDRCNETVYKLLVEGRTRESSFDVKQSPLAGYFYWYLGDELTESILQQVKVYPMNKEIAKQFLLLLPHHAVTYVAEKVAPLAVSRSHRILHVIHELYDNENNKDK